CSLRSLRVHPLHPYRAECSIDFEGELVLCGFPVFRIIHITALREPLTVERGEQTILHDPHTEADGHAQRERTEAHLDVCVQVLLSLTGEVEGHFAHSSL